MGDKNSYELEPVISDGNLDYFNKNPEDYKGIVLSTINKILITNSKLLSNTGKVYIKIGDQYIQQEENTLKIYYQLIDFLEDLLLFYFDEQAEEETKSQEEKRKSIYKKYFDLYVSKQTSESKKYKIQREGIIPKDDYLAQWCWENIEEETKKTYRKKLQSLLLLFKRKNELSGKRTARLGLGTG